MSSNEISKIPFGISTVQKPAVDSPDGWYALYVSKADVLEKKAFWLHLLFFGASDWQFLAATGADGEETKVPDGWHNKK